MATSATVTEHETMFCLDIHNLCMEKMWKIKKTLSPAKNQQQIQFFKITCYPWRTWPRQYPHKPMDVWGLARCQMTKPPTTVRNRLRAMASPDRGKDPHKKGKASCCGSSLLQKAKACQAGRSFRCEKMLMYIAMQCQQCPGTPEKKVGRLCWAIICYTCLGYNQLQCRIGSCKCTFRQARWHQVWNIQTTRP